MRLLLTVAASALVALAAGCATGEDSIIAADPGTTTSASPTAGDSGTASPTAGAYPSFAPADYTYELTVQCFCVGGGAPVEVTVADGEAVGAVYGPGATGRGGVEPGQPAGRSFWTSINDIIDSANQTPPDQVTVYWPAGQDHPRTVAIDGSPQIADDEVTYTIGHVQVSPAQ